MKLLQKGLLFASLLSVGASVVSVPLISGNGEVQAATTDYSKVSGDGFYYRLDNSEYIKASDVKVLSEDTEEDANKITTNIPTNFRLKVTASKARLYNNKGKELHRTLDKNTIYDIGSQFSFNDRTYFKYSKDELTKVNQSIWV